MNTHSQKADGMTLIEVLIAVAIFAVVIAISSAITTSLSVNSTSKEGLSVNQAAQEYLELLTEKWRETAKFGIMDSTVTPPRAVDKYSWSVTACEVDMADVSFACKASQTVTITPASGSTLTPTGAVLMRVSVKYTATTGGKTFVTSTEVYKR